jgi:hypothetical protein
MTPDKTPSDAELRALAVIDGGMLQDSRTANWFVTDADLLAFARAVLAKWGSPVVAVEVCRADAVNLARNALTQYDCAITKKGVRVLAEAVLSMDSALTTPQPIQAQAGAVDDTALIRRLVEVAADAQDEMCRTIAPRDSFTNAVDALDEAITAARARLKEIAP